jgi:hypothetical protein
VSGVADDAPAAPPAQRLPRRRRRQIRQRRRNAASDSRWWPARQLHAAVMALLLTPAGARDGGVAR